MSEDEGMSKRIDIEDFLLTEKERIALDPSCYKGFSFLVEILAESGSWRKGPVLGQIAFDYSPHVVAMEALSTRQEGYEAGDALLDPGSNQVEVILDVRRTLSWDLLEPHSTSRHLDVIVYSPCTKRSTNVCIVGKGSQNGSPVTDECASFVLWALSGFLGPPETLLWGVMEVVDSEAYGKFRIEQARLRETRLGQRRQVLRLRQLQIERRRALETELQIQMARLNSLTWAELAHEHTVTGAPSSWLQEILHEYRDSLLFPRDDQLVN
jgi:hypothetical protein|tara:strand:+ start:4691 stop:5494 length:804 start_codon:yes stop_codon:yes gene_type:complete